MCEHAGHNEDSANDTLGSSNLGSIVIQVEAVIEHAWRSSWRLLSSKIGRVLEGCQRMVCRVLGLYP